MLAQVALSFFKLCWNSVCTPYLIRLIANRMSPSTHDNDFVTVQVVIALFNNIAVPCLVVLIESPSCFYSVFSPPASVDSLFLYETCAFYGPTGQCALYGGQVVSTSYDPPFVYDFQCSSSFITYYAPAFVYLSITAIFVTPLFKHVVQRLHRRATPGTCWHAASERLLPKIMRPILIAAESESPCPPPPTEFSTPGTDSVDSTATHKAIERDVFRPFFDAHMFIITLLTYLGILLTFGVVFPPLALAMSVTMISVAWHGKLAVGRFIQQARELNAPQYIDIIEQECKGAVTIAKIRRSVFIIICFSCFFYALFLFDTLGNEIGKERAFWVLIFMPLFPLLIYEALKLRRRHQGVLTLDYHLNKAATAAAAHPDEGVTMTELRLGKSVHAESVMDEEEEGGATYNTLQA
jgi:hypothetical protein